MDENMPDGMKEQPHPDWELPPKKGMEVEEFQEWWAKILKERGSMGLGIGDRMGWQVCIRKEKTEEQKPPRE